MAPRPTQKSTDPYDAGGELQPGTTSVENRTGEPEVVVAPATVVPDPRAPKVEGRIVYAYGGRYTLEDAVLLGIISVAEGEALDAQVPSA